MIIPLVLLTKNRSFLQRIASNEEMLKRAMALDYCCSFFERDSTLVAIDKSDDLNWDEIYSHVPAHSRHRVIEYTNVFSVSDFFAMISDNKSFWPCVSPELLKYPELLWLFELGKNKRFCEEDVGRYRVLTTMVCEPMTARELNKLLRDKQKGTK